MTWQLANAKVWDGSQWVAAVGASPVMAGVWTSVARNVIVTASTTAHTKGAWVELIASNAAATDWVEIYVEGVGANGVNTATLLDIGVGAAGAETAVISDVAVGGAQGIRFDLPLAIASGQRISARIQSVVTGGKTATVFLQTFAAGINAPSSVTTIGTSTANSEGTTFSPANTWVQITAATATDFQYLVFVPSLTSTAVSPSAGGFVDLASGASGSEVIVSRLVASWSTTEAISLQFPLLAIGVPAGTRLSGRAPRADIDGTVIGIPYP